MESVRSIQGGPNLHYTSVECRSSGHTKKAETDVISKATRGSSEEIEAGGGH